MLRVRVFGTIVLSILSSACGARTTVDSDSSGVGGNGVGGGGSVGGGSGTGGSPVGCPTSRPNQGESCSGEGIVCTWGSSPLPQCRDSAYCDAQAGWFVNIVPPDCDQPNPSCPTEEPQGACAPEGTLCTYPGGAICLCTTCLGGPCGPPPAQWSCGAPASGCPSIPPNAGTVCPTDGQLCEYGNPCDAGVSALCDPAAHAWSWQSVVCPL